MGEAMSRPGGETRREGERDKSRAGQNIKDLSGQFHS